jgi:hypothetical protein
LCAEALHADLTKIVEVDHATNTGRVRAGVGWQPALSAWSVSA